MSIYTLFRDVALARRAGTRYERRRAERALAHISHGDMEAAFRAWNGITPRVRVMRFGADAIHPGGRVRGGGDWRDK